MLAIKPASIYNGAVKDSGLWKKPIDAFSVMGLLLPKTVWGSRVMSGNELKETASFKIFKRELVQSLRPNFGKLGFGKLARSFIIEYLESKGVTGDDLALNFKYLNATVNAKNGAHIQKIGRDFGKEPKPKAKKNRSAMKVVALPKPVDRKRHPFYDSRPWFAIRYRALKICGAACQCCGRTRKDGIVLHVDHIKPRADYPELELEITNLQVLCNECNLGKSNVDETDWRTA